MIFGEKRNGAQWLQKKACMGRSCFGRMLKQNPVDMQWRARQDVMIFRQGPCTDGGNPHKIR